MYEKMYTNGCKTLEQIIKEKCPDAIHNVSLKQLQNRVIVIDASIYMYRFASQGTLVPECIKCVLYCCGTVLILCCI